MVNHRGLLFTLVSFLVSSISVSAKCSSPTVRREWRSLSVSERTDWINAVKCLAKVPHKDSLTPIIDRNESQIPPVNPNSSYYDDFVYLHMDLNPVIHFTGQFLPWHRAFVNDFEFALRRECGFSGSQPYWDWTQDADNYYNASIWDPSPTSGFGGWGDPNNDSTITTGAFSYDFDRVYPIPHTIRREFTPSPGGPNGGGNPFGDGTPGAPGPLTQYITLERVQNLTNNHIGDFEGFHAAFEGTTGQHGAPHVVTGGDLGGGCPRGAPDCHEGPKWTPNDPLFLLHHAMVDKIWSDWQNKHEENFWSYHGGSVGAHSAPGIYAQFPNGGPPFLNFGTPVPSDGILNEYTIYDLMDTTGDSLCYIYE